MKDQYIGIDFGASTGRIILGSIENKKMSYKEIHRWPTEGMYVFDTYRWNVMRFWEEIKKGLKKIKKSPDINLRSIGVDSWGVNLVYLDEDNELTCQPFHYRDNLIENGMKKKEQLFDLKRVYEITGIQAINLNAIVHLSGIVEKYPNLLKRTKKICMIPDYFNYLLTGELKTEYTNATTTELLDANSRMWSDEILQKFGLSSSVFADMQYPGDLIGNLHPTVMEETNLPAIPVYSIASHDTGSAVIGVPGEGENWAYLSSGTWSLLGVEIPKPIISETGRRLNLTNEGGAFDTIRYLKNIMGLWLLQRSKAVWDEEASKKGEKVTYSMISKEAEEVESKRSIIPVDAPCFFNPKNMITAIQNYCRKNDQPVPETRGQIARCIYDSLAVRYKEVLGMIEEATGKKVDALYVVGGGSKDDLLNQTTANELGLKVYAGPVEATAVGNIMMQAYAAGQVKDLTEIREIIKNSFEIKCFNPFKTI